MAAKSPRKAAKAVTNHQFVAAKNVAFDQVTKFVVV